MPVFMSRKNLYIALLFLFIGENVTAQTVRIFAGNGIGGFSGDGGPATAASFSNSTQGICADAVGNIYIGDVGNNRVRKVTPFGTVTTVAGNGTWGYTGDGGPATAASLKFYGVSCDPVGNLLIGDWVNERVRRVDAVTGIITTVAGNGISGSLGDGGPATAAQLFRPIDAAYDTAHNIVISEYSGGRIRKVDAATGTISTIAGPGFSSPDQIAMSGPTIYVARQSGRVSKIDASGVVSTFAGGGAGVASGVPATSTSLLGPQGVAVDCIGNVYIADNDHNLIRRVDVSTGIITTIAGGGAMVPTLTGVPALSAGFHNELLCFDSFGNLYITDDHSSYVWMMPGVSAASSVSPITGPSSICIGSVVTLGNATTGGIWSISGSSAAISATGDLTGISAGTATVTYTVASACGTFMSTMVINVFPPPTTGPIAGPTMVCVGDTIVLTNSTSGGMWSSGSGNVSIGSSGTVTGIIAGTATISYVVSNACDTVVVTSVITVNPLPSTPSITGPATVCVGGIVTLNATPSGGSWTSTSGVATVSAIGEVTGISTGTTTISYSNTNSCGTVVGIKIVTVYPIPTVNPITGPTLVCTGSTITLSNTTLGGSWSISSGSATVSATGVVTGVTAGTATLSYIVSNVCGTVAATTVITVDPLPGTPSITGPATVCVGDTIALTSTPPGGSWSSTSGSATVSPTGVVTGVSGGTTTISYSYTSSCGTVVASKIITVNPLPTVNPITGPVSVCAGSTIALSNTTPGGVWSTTSGMASVSTTGVVTGVSAGTALISYTVGNICDTISATYVVTVDAVPVMNPVDGPSSLCVGTTVTLTCMTPGGSWTSLSPGIATIGTGGVVTGISGGTAIISYTISNACGTFASSTVVTVNTPPVVNPIIGPSSVCAGLTITFTCTPAGGTWAITGSTATVSSTGVVTGSAPGGTVTVSYSMSDSCGTTTVAKIVTVNLFPDAGTISGPHSVCAGSTITLTSTVPGGTWSIPSASVSVSSSGVVTGLAAGTALISYTVVNGCGPAWATYVVTVLPLPDPGVIGGPATLCTGATIILTNPVPGGVWSSSSGNVTISSTGVVAGVSVGTAIISYTVNDGHCSARALDTVTVITLPDPGEIIAVPSICLNQVVTVTSTVSGGVWSCSDPAISVTPGGVVTGLTYGGAILSYTVTNMCGSVTITKLISVFPNPDPVDITGSPLLCLGETKMYVGTSPIGAGSWVSADPTIATIDISGTIKALSVGTTIITYSVTNSAGCASEALLVVTVAPLPEVGIISGPSEVCTGGSYTMQPTGAGGTWTSSNPSVATIDPVAGRVTCIKTGTVMITYTTPPNSYGCSNFATFTIAILSSAPFYINEAVEHVRCYGGTDGSIAVSASNGTGPWYHTWSNGAVAARLESLPAGKYEVELLDSSTGCRAREAYIITQPDSLDIMPTVKNEQCAMANGSITVKVSGGTSPYTYAWFNSSAGEGVTGLGKGTYEMSVSDKNLCRKALFADVLDGGCEDIEVTGGVSPNEDGVNDRWLIKGIENYPNNVVQLFDKWGDLVFEKYGYSNDWDGTGRAGKPLPDGTYFYVIKLNARNGAGGKDVFTGSILMKR